MTIAVFNYILWYDFVSDKNRLDVKAQKIDSGYPRYTDVVFGGVPNDSHDVFQYKGKHTCQFLKKMIH